MERWRESGCQRRNERQETAVHKCPGADAHRAPCPEWSLVRWTRVPQLSLDRSKSVSVSSASKSERKKQSVIFIHLQKFECSVVPCQNK